jgi:hypothetical protein
MITLVRARFAIGASLVAVAVIATMAMKTPIPVTVSPVCTFTIDDPLPIGPDPVTATTTFTAAIGDSLSATFPDDSRVTVVSIKRTRVDTPLTATIVVATMRAVAGQWAVTVHGDKGECAGRIWVGQGAKAKKSRS